MTDRTLPSKQVAGQRGPMIGRRLLLWIETRQQRKADFEIARILRRV